MEREVSIKLKVPRDGDNGKAFEDLARNARELDKEVKGAGKAISEMLRAEYHEERITKALRSMGVEMKAAGDAAAKLMQQVGDGAKVTQREIEKLGAGLKALGHTAAESGATGGQGSFLQRFAGVNSLSDLMPAGLARFGRSPMGAMGISATMVNLGLNRIEDEMWNPEAPAWGPGTLPSRQYAGYQADRFAESGAARYTPLVSDINPRMAMDLGLGPIGSYLMPDSVRNAVPNETLRDRRNRIEEERRLADQRRQLFERDAERLPLITQHEQRQQSLELDRERMRRMSTAVPRARWLGSVSERALRFASEPAQDVARMFGRDPREVAARYAHAGAARQLEIKQGLEAGELDARRGELAEIVERRRRAVEQARMGEAHAERSLGDPELNNRQRAGRIADLERARALVQKETNQFLEAEGALLDANKQKQMVLLQQSEQRVSLLSQERDRLTGVVAAEKDRVHAGQVAFGKLTKPQQARAARLAEQARAGVELNRQQLEFLGGVQGAEKLTERQYLGRVNQKDFERFAGATQLQRPLKEAEAARIAIDNKIAVELNVNAQSVAQQFQQLVLPQVMQMLTDMKTQFQSALISMDTQRRAQEGSMTR